MDSWARATAKTGEITVCTLRVHFMFLEHSIKNFKNIFCFLLH